MRKHLLFLIAPIMLCGCSVIPSKEQAETELRKQTEDNLAEIQAEDSEYREYKSKADADQLDADGYYHDSEMDTVNVDPNSIFVTFAKNAQLDILYYYDAAHQRPITANQPCYIPQGETIFVGEPEHEAAGNDNYSFSGFILYSFDEAGNYKKIEAGVHTDSMTIQLPSERTIHNISVVPIGAYRHRVLNLEDWYVDENGQRKPMNGTWYQGEKRITDNTFEITAPESYTFSYRFDAEKYYVTDSSASDASESNGRLFFKNITVDQETLSVLLKPYYQSTISAPKDAVSQVTVDGRTQTVSDNNNYCLKKLRPGQKIVIRTNPEYKISCGELNEQELNINKIDEGFDFSCIVPENGKDLNFTADKWGEKNIAVNVDTSIFEKIPFIRALFQKQEDKLLTLCVGKKEYTYKQLKKEKNITVNESQDITLIVNSNISTAPNLAYEISVNGQNPIYVYKGNQEPPKLSFSGTETLDITVKKGFVFSYQNLNNGDLEVEYRLADGQTLLTENQFLPEKSEVTVTVKNPDDYTVTGGAIQAGEYAGTVTVTDKTNISDFAVQSTKKG